MSDKKKVFPVIVWLQWMSIMAILAVIVAGNYMYSDYSLFYRVLIAFSMLIVAGGILYMTPQGYNLYKLALQARLELARVIWPTRPEIMQTFVAVMAVVGVVMLMLWMMDAFFSWLAFVLLG